MGNVMKRWKKLTGQKLQILLGTTIANPSWDKNCKSFLGQQLQILLGTTIANPSRDGKLQILLRTTIANPSWDRNCKSFPGQKLQILLGTKRANPFRDRKLQILLGTENCKSFLEQKLKILLGTTIANPYRDRKQQILLGPKLQILLGTKNETKYKCERGMPQSMHPNGPLSSKQNPLKEVIYCLYLQSLAIGIFLEESAEWEYTSHNRTQLWLTQWLFRMLAAWASRPKHTGRFRHN